MSGPRTLVVGLALLAAGAAGGLAWAKDKVNKKAEPARTELGGGKYLRFHLKTGGSPPVLEGAEARRLGDRWFLTGRVLYETQSYSRGSTVWFPLESVTQMVGYDPPAPDPITTTTKVENKTVETTAVEAATTTETTEKK